MKIRARFFVAVEGKSEQSFIRWLQLLSEKESLHIHLDCVPLGGGGFKSMLQRAVRAHSQRSRIAPYQDRFLIVDGDRSDQGDWSISELRNEATKFRMTVCVQVPNHEGLLFRMMPGMERGFLDATTAEMRLKRMWPDYQKPMNAFALQRKFSLDALVCVAKADMDLQVLLKKIGLLAGHDS